MAGIVIKRLSEQEKKEMNIPERPAGSGSWSVWECEPSVFNWHYDDEEHAFVYQGKVKVKTQSEEVEIKAGDYVIFPKDLNCTWTVQEKIKKVYKFV